MASESSIPKPTSMASAIWSELESVKAPGEDLSIPDLRRRVLDEFLRFSGSGVAGELKLRNIRKFETIEPEASSLAKTVSAGDEETSYVIKFTLVELLRNVLQHSLDPNGAAVDAQCFVTQPGKPPVIELLVADEGIGLPTALRGMHPELAAPSQALMKAIEPYVSGTFAKGLTGNGQNAGMGLFMISQMAKLTAGRFVLATRGATLQITGDQEGGDEKIDLLERGVQGTLVVFELALGEVKDFQSLLEVIRKKAHDRAPASSIQPWLRYEPGPAQATRIRVLEMNENTPAAMEFARNRLVPMLARREPVILDLSGIKICTQSFLHALLFEPLRLAWALHVPIYVEHAAPPVRTALDLLEGYALKG